MSPRYLDVDWRDIWPISLRPRETGFEEIGPALSLAFTYAEGIVPSVTLTALSRKCLASASVRRQQPVVAHHPRLLRRHGGLLRTGHALSELDPTQPLTLAPFPAGASRRLYPGAE